jgi:hypothetical protein
LPFAEWKSKVAEKDADATWGHLEHSPNCYSIIKPRRWLDYQPRYSSLQAIYEAVQRLIADGVIL